MPMTGLPMTRRAGESAPQMPADREEFEPAESDSRPDVREDHRERLTDRERCPSAGPVMKASPRDPGLGRAARAAGTTGAPKPPRSNEGSRTRANPTLSGPAIELCPIPPQGPGQGNRAGARWDKPGDHCTVQAIVALFDW